MSAPALPWIAQRLYARLPETVLCGRDFWCLRRRPKTELALHRYAQLNRYGWITCLDFDCDYPTATDVIRDPALPPWSWAVHNHANHHLHVGWILEIPLNNRKQSPRAVLNDVYGQLCARIGADPCHHGRGPIPNPFYAGGFDRSTEWGSAHPMRCADFYEWLDGTTMRLEVPTQPGRPLTGEGRNVDLFNAVRREAAAVAHTAKGAGWGKRRFSAHVFGIAEQANRAFSKPLPEWEVKATARSIARYAWEHRNDERQPFDQAGRQAHLGKRSGKARQARLWDRTQQVAALAKAGHSQRTIARRTGETRGFVVRALRRCDQDLFS